MGFKQFFLLVVTLLFTVFTAVSANLPPPPILTKKVFKVVNQQGSNLLQQSNSINLDLIKSKKCTNQLQTNDEYICNLTTSKLYVNSLIFYNNLKRLNKPLHKFFVVRYNKLL